MSSKGFTLVEILITIMILSVLATAGIIFFRDSFAKGRDERRKQDLQKISHALELFYQINKRYPGTPGEWTNSSSSNWLTGLVPTYFESLPKPPNASQGEIYTYHLSSNSECSSITDAQFYLLMARLENADSQDLASKDVTNCDGSSIRSILPLPGYNQAYILTPA
jgi:prepilin-type N-terminal cleavage/methylation domain-containing protein